MYNHTDKLIVAVLAMDDYYGIGKNNTLPWPKNSLDLAWFKDVTLNTMTVMGRKTWESLPIKPLPHRRNVVITKNVIPNVETMTLEEFKSGRFFNSWPITIIGGAQLINSTLDIIDELWISRIKGNYNCDTFFPYQRAFDQFEIASKTHEENGLNIETYIRKIDD